MIFWWSSCIDNYLLCVFEYFGFLNKFFLTFFHNETFSNTLISKFVLLSNLFQECEIFGADTDHDIASSLTNNSSEEDAEEQKDSPDGQVEGSLSK